MPGVARIAAPKRSFKRNGTIVVRRVRAQTDAELRQALRSAGLGLDVELRGTSLRRPLTVAYRVGSPPPGFKPRYLHVSDSGEWEVQGAVESRAAKPGWLLTRTKSFSIGIPSWIKPSAWWDTVKSWARSAGRWVAKAIGGRTDPLRNCGSPPPGWFGYSQRSDLVHTCTIDNAGRAEIQIKSNRGVAMMVSVPGNPAYVWVEDRPAWVRKMQASIWEDPDREVLLGPGQRMTVGYAWPPSDFQGNFTVSLDDPRAWLDNLIRGAVDLVGDTPAAALITYTMTQCATGLQLGLGSARLSPSVSLDKAGCMFDALVGLANDPEKALKIVVGFGGNNGDAEDLLRKARALSLFAKALGVLAPVKDLALRAIDDSLRSLLNDGNTRIAIRLEAAGGAATGSGPGPGPILPSPLEPIPQPELESPNEPVAVGTADSPLDWGEPEHVPHGEGGPRWFGNWIVDVSCGSPSLCVGIDDVGNAMVSTEPMQNRWHLFLVDPHLRANPFVCPLGSICFRNLSVGAGGSIPRATSGLSDISCPSPHLCVAVDAYGNVVWSTDPADPGSWQVEEMSERWLYSVECPTEDFCMAGDGSGRLLATTDPTSGGASWSVISQLDMPDGSDSITEISCPTATRCFAVNEVTYIENTVATVWTSANPTAPDNWSSVASTGQPILGLSCPTLSLCVANDLLGRVISSAQPSQPGSWNGDWVTFAGGLGFYWPPGGGVSCTAGGFCMFGGESNDVWYSSDPIGGDWQRNTSLGVPAVHVSTVMCQSATACIGATAIGGTLATTTPAGSWSNEFIDPQRSFRALACGSSDRCAATDIAGAASLVSGIDGGARTWETDDTWENQYGVALSCVEDELCVSVTESGDVVVTDRPGEGGWTSKGIAGNQDLNDVACPSVFLCVAVGSVPTEGGDLARVFTNTNPTNADSSWSPMDLSGVAALASVSCPSSSFCVAVDKAGNVVSSTAPLDQEWSEPTRTDPYGLTGVSCSSSQLCVAVDRAGYVLSSQDPQDPTSWSAPSGISGGPSLRSVSCAGVLTLCVAVASDGKVLASSDPTAGTAGWSPPAAIDNAGGVADAACFSGQGCVTVGRNGRVVWGARD